MDRTIKPATLKAILADKHLIDVRRQADLDASSESIPGATWHDSEQLGEWQRTCRGINLLFSIACEADRFPTAWSMPCTRKA